MSEEYKQEMKKTYLAFLKFREQLRKMKKYGKIRLPNFPECISEYVAYRSIQTFIYPEVRFSGKKESGDLIYGNKKLEVKCFSSKGPISFSPVAKCSEFYIIDMTNQPVYKIYRLSYSNKDKRWLNLKMNKNQTFEYQIKSGRRPRITFAELSKQLKSDLELIDVGNLKYLLKN